MSFVDRLSNTLCAGNARDEVLEMGQVKHCASNHEKHGLSHFMLLGVAVFSPNIGNLGRLINNLINF